MRVKDSPYLRDPDTRDVLARVDKKNREALAQGIAQEWVGEERLAPWVPTSTIVDQPDHRYAMRSYSSPLIKVKTPFSNLQQIIAEDLAWSDHEELEALFS